MAYRKWGELPIEEGAAIEFLGLTSHSNRGRSFRSTKEEYIELWCRWNVGEPPALDDVFPGVDGYGIAPLWCAVTDGALLVSLRLPPGLDPGTHHARLKVGTSRWSDTCHFYVGLPPITTPLQLLSVQDGASWKTGEVDWTLGGWATVWVDGLSEEADAGNTVVHVSGVPHVPEVIHPGSGQINIHLRPLIQAGIHAIHVVHRAAESNSLSLSVVGAAATVRGLERCS